MMTTEERVEQSIENIADLLWLSQYTGISTSEEEHSNSSPQKPTEKEKESSPPKPIDNPSKSDELEIHTKDQNSTRQQGTKPAKAFRSPKRLALSNYREWEKAFKFINLQRLSQTVRELDEEATADFMAMSGIYDLKFHYLEEKFFTLTVVIDRAETMELWDELIKNFKDILLRQGVFKTIHIYYLDSNDSTAKLYHDKKLKQSTHKKSILTNSKSSLIWVMSDCLGASWESGDAFRLIDEWSRYSFTSIIQMFPKQMWMGTMLYQTKQTRFETKNFHPSNKKLLHRSKRARKKANGTKIPVVTFNPYALQSWAKVVTNHPNSSISGIETQDFEFEHSAVDQSTVTLEDRMDRFYSQASLPAQKLAFYMSVLPVDYTVVRMLQELKFEQREHVHIAEVFLSGLIKRQKVNDAYSYEFYEGVRERLNANLTAKESIEILQGMSGFISEHLGVEFDFDALIRDPSSLLGDGNTISDESIAFAKIVSDALQRGGGKWLEIGREIEESIEKSIIEDREVNFPVIVNTSISPDSGTAGNYFTFTAYLSAPLADGHSVYLNFDNLAGGWLNENQDGGHIKLNCSGKACSIDKRIGVSGSRKVRMGVFKDGSLSVINEYSTSIGFDVNKETEKGFVDSIKQTYSQAKKSLQYLFSREDIFTLNLEKNKKYDNLEVRLDNIKEYDEIVISHKKPIKISSKDDVDYYNKGVTYDNLGEQYNAIASYQKAIEINPRNHNAYNNLGSVYADLGEYTQAIAFYKEVIKINPQFEMVYYNMGITYGNLGEYSKAIASYQKALKLNSKDDNIYYNIGWAQHNQGKYSKAIISYQKAVGINPDNDKAYYNIGLSYFNKKEYDKAIQSYQKALEINPKNDEAYNNIGNAYKYKQEYDKAISFYKKAIEANIELDIAYNNLENLYKKMGKDQKEIDRLMAVVKNKRMQLIVEKISSINKNSRSSGTPEPNQLLHPHHFHTRLP